MTDLSPRDVQVTLRDLPATTLMGLLPHLDQDVLWNVRQELAQRAAGLRSTVGSWQEAWNTITSATPNRPGEVRFYAHVTCPNCHGRRFDPRTARACMQCMAQGKKHTHVSLLARYAPLPAPEPVQ